MIDPIAASHSSNRIEWIRTRAKIVQKRLSFRGIAGFSVVGIMIIMGLFAPFLAPRDPELVALASRLQPPVWSSGGTAEHILGTDPLGRDLLSRIIFGARISLTIALSAVTISAFVGVTLGLMSGYFGGLVDTILMRLVDIMLAFPFILLALTWMSVFSPGQRNVVIVLAITGWATFCRMTRGQVLSMREREYVVAAHVIGASSARVIAQHILPNLLPTIIVIATMQTAQFILAEATLSFLGLGITPQTPSWGGIINEGRSYVTQAWWIQTFPGIAIILTVSGIGLLGDWLRDTLDPKLRIG